jgi:hypothetical protein
LSAQAPRGPEEAAGVCLVLDCRRNRPVHGEPRAHRRWRIGGFGWLFGSA